VLPTREIEKPAQRPRTAFRPTLIDGARPALDLGRLTAVMASLEGYIEASMIAFQELEPPPSISDDALDIRLICL
jgi:hypothetical protein